MTEDAMKASAAIEAAAAAAAAAQPTPCGIHRKLLLLLYLWYAFSTGCVYLGWAALSRLLYSSGVYEVLCDSAAAAAARAAHAAQAAAAGGAKAAWEEPLCAAQEVAMNKLFTIAMASHFSSSILVGLLLDRWGPSKTALVGQAVGISGWSLLASLGQEDVTLPVVAFVLIGLAVDASLLPCLGIGNVFPGRRGIVMASMGAAASASMAVPLLLLRIAPESNVRLGRLWFYVGLGPGLCLLLTQFILPRKPFKGKAEIQVDMMRLEPKTPQAEVLPNRVQQLPTSAAAAASAAAAGGGSGDSSSNTDKESVLSASAAASAAQEAAAAAGGGGRSSKEEAQPSFLRLLLSLDYLFLVLYFMGSAAAAAFFQQTCRRLLPPAAVSFLEVLMATEMLFSLPVGALIDTAGVLPALYVLNSSGLVSYLLTIPAPRGFHFASAVFFVLYISMLRGPVLIFLQSNYPAAFFGRLAGVAALLGGVMTLCLNPLLDFALRHGPTGVKKARAAIVGLLLLQYVWLTTLFVRRRRKRVQQQCQLQQQHRQQQQLLLQRETV